MKQSKPFELNELVTWKTPEDQKHWEREYRHLTELFGEGSFQVEALYYRNVWYAVLKRTDGTTLLDRRKGPELFPASWLKRVEHGAA